MDTNPFVALNSYSREDLKQMSREELIEAQRSVLLPQEKEAFDAGGSLRFLPGDARDPFFEFTDNLILR